MAGLVPGGGRPFRPYFRGPVAPYLAPHFAAPPSRWISFTSIPMHR